MIEKLDIEIDPLEEGLEIGGIVVGKPVALGQHADQNLVAVSSIDAVSIGAFKLSTLNADINEIMDQYKAEIRSVRRNTAGQPSQVVIRVRRKPEEAGPVPDPQQEEEEEVELLSRRQLSVIGSNPSFRNAFRDTGLREWAESVVNAPEKDRESILSQALGDPRCGPMIENLMDEFVETCR